MENQDQSLRFRPRFKLEVDMERDALLERLRSVLDDHQDFCTGEFVDHHVILRIRKAQQHFWSPQLTLELSPKGAGTTIRGLFGPKPTVWTMFVFFYSAIGFLTLMGLIFGLSQMMLKMDAFGLWAVPVGSVLLLGLFVMSKVGQKLGQHQMNRFHEILTEALGQKQ
jgi:hypothetical protein